MLSIKLLIAIAFFGTACFLDLRDFTDFIYSVSILTTNLEIKRSAPQFSFLEYLAVTYLLMIVKWAMIYLFIFDVFILAEPASVIFSLQVIIQTIFLGNPKFVAWLDWLTKKHEVLEHTLQTIGNLASTIVLSLCYEHFFQIGHSPLNVAGAIFWMSIVDPIIMMFGMLEYSSLAEAFAANRKDILSNILLYSAALGASWIGYFHFGYKEVHRVTVWASLVFHILISSAPTDERNAKTKQE